MKRKEFLKEVRGLDKSGLEQRARSIAEELMKLRFRKVATPLEKPHRSGLLKRELARIKTILNESKQESVGQ